MRRISVKRVEENDVNEGLPSQEDKCHKVCQFLKVFKVLNMIISILWKEEMRYR